MRLWARIAPLIPLSVKRALYALRREPDLLAAQQAAVHWLRANTVAGKGIAVTHRSRGTPYPEVTGYLIPTLMSWGEHDLAEQYARWLVSIQNSDGSWSDATGSAPYVFDTGQVLKGLLAIYPRCPEVESSIRRGCDWLLSRMSSEGRLVTPFKGGWVMRRGGLGLAMVRRFPRFSALLRAAMCRSGQAGLPDSGSGGREEGVSDVVPESIHLYVVEPLLRAGELLAVARYCDAATKALQYYMAQPDLVAFASLSHFHAYVMLGLVEMRRADLASQAMTEVEMLQHRDGSVPAYPDEQWVCVPAVAQYAVVWYRLGRLDPARRALGYLCRVQNRSGGFFGGRGLRAIYFPREEVPWAAKYFLDALSWHIRTAFDEETDSFPDTVSADDSRVAAVISGLGDLSGRKILDAGCGKGRIAEALKEGAPDAEIWGLDVSDAMVRAAATRVRAVQGTLLDIPFPDHHFDAAYCVEALEHAVQPAVAIQELCRVVRPGGRIVIVDKNRELRGLLRAESWERWFAREEVERWLAFFCTDVRSEAIASPDGTSPTGLFIAWTAVKRASSR